MKKKNLFRAIFIPMLATLIFGFVSGKEKEHTQKEYDIITTRKVDTDGNVHRLGIENKKASPVALVFIEVGCVISQRMVPELNETFLKSQEKGVKFYGVISNAKATWQEARKFKEEFDIQFPILFDSNGDLARRINPTVVPESFVFNINDELQYYGRINDEFVAVGKVNKNSQNDDLLDAIKSVSIGEKPEQLHQPAIGCIFQPWPSEISDVTFNKDIEPILRANCVNCHKPNDIGPFPLISYDDASRRGSMIEFVTRKGYMPIWKAEKGYGKFSNEHTLSANEIELIQAWVKSGMVEGESEDLMPPLKDEAKEWKLGEPDIILEMEAYDLPASGDDQYRVFVMKNKIPKGKIIRAIDFKPGDPAVVHHSTIFIDYTGALSKYDKADPEPGYDAFQNGGTMEFGSAIPVCGWAPGIGPYSYPDDVGFYVESSAQLAFENHYHLSGKATTDKSYVGIYYADKPVNKFITGSIIGTQKLQIAANETSYKKSIWTYVPNDIELYDFTPHMHYIGKSVQLDVIFPNGEKKNLLKIKDWDLRWQSVYTLRELTIIPKGSIITAEFEFDNSDDNPDNPKYPAEDMFWGWASDDEMCEVYFSYIPLDYNDYGKMMSASFASFEHFYGFDERVSVREDNLVEVKDKFIQCDVWSDEGQKLLLSIVESQLANEVVTLMEKEQKVHKDDINFTVNLKELSMASAYSALDIPTLIREATETATLLYEHIKPSAENWNACMSYAKIMLESESKQYEKEGLRIMLDLIDVQEQLPAHPKYSKPYWQLGKYYYGQRDDSNAEKILKRGLVRHPKDEDLNQELASDGRIVKKTLND